MTKQPRRYATYEGKRYRLLPWLKEGQCNGCVFEHKRGDQCPNDEQYAGEPCNDDGVYSGMIFVECGKEGLAKYIADKLGGFDD